MRLIARDAATGSGIDRAIGAVTNRPLLQRLRNLAARAPAWIDQAHHFQLFQRIAVTINMLRLKLHLSIIGQAQPRHILENRVDMLWPAACAVNILDSQHEVATKLPGKIMRA